MTHRILLADDSVTIRKVVELTFSDEDFTIDSVGDGAKALERARADRPDIVISDVIMPGLNGYELCEQLKSDQSLRSIPFLFLKGTFESFDEQKANACGADGFIVKPFESQELIARVKELIAAGPSVTAAPTQALPRAAAPAPSPAYAAAPVRPPAAAPVPPYAAPSPVAATPPPAAPPPPQAPSRTPAMPPVMPAAARAPVAAPPPMPARPPAPPVAPVPTAPRPAPPVPPTPPRPVPPPPVPARPVPPPPAPPRPAPPPPPPPPAPRPERPFAPPPPPPPEPEPFQFPATPFEPPAPQRPPSPIEEFGFDFGEAETAPAAASEAPFAAAAAPVHEQPGETDEDLWSEVSLRDRGTDILEAPGSAAPPLEWPDTGGIGLEEVPGADETTFEEVPAGVAQLEPEPSVEQFEDFEPPAAPPAVRPEEAPQAPAAQVREPEIAAAGGSLDQEALQQMVAAQVQAAVRRVLEPLVNDLARGMVESIAWEVIPELAEVMIRTEIERIRQSTRTD